jgi:hypothetical protein
MTQTSWSALPRPNRRWDVFLSHASEDLEIAHRLCTALERSGWSVFLAARDLPGQIQAAEWTKRIDEQLDASGALVVLASPEALEKQWVTYEWRSFHNDVLGNRGGWIVPCCVRGVAPDELERALRHYQAVDFREARNWDTAVTGVLTLVEGYLKRPIRAAQTRVRPRVLTIGGAGTRTVVALASLERLETELERHGTTIVDSFDLIVGDSVGAYLAARLGQAEAVDTIKNELNVLLPAITTRSNLLRRFYSLYSTSEVQKRLRELLGASQLAAAPKCAISTFDIATNQHRLWSSRLPLTAAEASLPLADLVAASVAAPVYFAPIELTTDDGRKLSLIDGSVWVADPARSGLDAVRKIVTPTPLIADVLLVSIGSGRHMSPGFADASQGNVVSTGMAMTNLLLQANREAVDEHVKGLFREAGALQNYLRFDPELPADQNWPMDTLDDLDRMRSFAQSWVASRSDVFRHAAELVATHAGPGATPP